MAVHPAEWTFYLLGAILTLVYKWCRWVYIGRKQGQSILESSIVWFLEPSAENITSWVATIGGVWVLGVMYIDRAIDVPYITDVPVLKSAAFLIGALSEIIVPNVLKWIVNKFPGA